MRKKTGAIDLTTGNEMRAIVVFALPLIAGNLFQQLYNLMDTMIVGKFIGADALAAVGSSYMTMNFLTSIIIGLCMGSGIVFSWFYGSRQREKLEQSMFQSFLFILAVTVMITSASLVFLDQLLYLLNIESSIFQMTRAYLFIIICGMGFVFLYNYFCLFLINPIVQMVKSYFPPDHNSAASLLRTYLKVRKYHLATNAQVWLFSLPKE